MFWDILLILVFIGMAILDICAISQYYQEHKSHYDIYKKGWDKGFKKASKQTRIEVCDEIRQTACRFYEKGTTNIVEYCILAEDLDIIEEGDDE